MFLMFAPPVGEHGREDCVIAGAFGKANDEAGEHSDAVGVLFIPVSTS